MKPEDQKAFEAAWAKHSATRPVMPGDKALCGTFYERALAHRDAQPAGAQGEPVATVYEIGRHMSIVLTAHGKSVLTHNQKLYAEPRAVSEPRTHVDDAAQKLDKLLGQVINRRVMVEQKLFDMAAGKLPMPDADGLRKLAMELGDPAHNPPAAAINEVLYQALRHLYHNAKKSGAEIGLALDIAEDALKQAEAEKAKGGV